VAKVQLFFEERKINICFDDWEKNVIFAL